MTIYERNVRAFEGRDISPTPAEVEAMVRRERFKATRAPFQRVYFKGAESVPANGSRSFNIASSTTRDIERLKRIQLKIAIPKGLGYGWLGFVREPEAVSVITSPPFDAPIVLRPTVWLGNEDYATYWDAYLPAINLADGGQLLGIIANDTGTTKTVTYVGRMVLERGIEG